MLRYFVRVISLLLPFTGGSQLVCLSKVPLPDPVVIRQDAWWYITGTLPYMFTGKELTPEALTRVPVTFDTDGLPVTGIWGFSLFRNTDGTWHGYGTLHYGFFRTVIAHFVPEAGQAWTPGNPICRWKFDKVLIGDVLNGEFTMYDQKLYRSENGQLYLIYNASPAPHENVHILAQHMIDPETVDSNSPPQVLLAPEELRSEDRNPGSDLQLTEGTTIRKLGNKYLLLYSVGDFEQRNYKVGAAWSDELIPPNGQTYQKVKIPDVSNVWKNLQPTNEVCYLLQSQLKNWPNWCGDSVLGPGIANLVEETLGHFSLVFHGYPPDEPPVLFDSFDPARRLMYKLPVEVQIDPARPMNEWIKPILPEKTP